jgi:hypothetical protein
MKKQHGGRRPGAGRPALGLKRVQVLLAQAHITKVINLGDGNLSRGVRRAVEAYKNDQRLHRGWS